ncbi:HD domain-containing protein [Bernardetia sp. ABR2-2B]|uniref:HD domain-containing protein n=1 Tax=Bernardetia sp. ABR2-2B TaxID=3127472 RepID=UPI0030CBAC1D
MNNTDLYREALYFACKAHEGQKMSSSVPNIEFPYFLHITEVMTETLSAFQETLKNTTDKNLNQDLGVLVAILHDTVEDTSVTLEEIEKQFGEEVKNGVWAMTKNEKLPKEQQMNDSLEKLSRQPIEVQFVKLADRIVNLKEPPHYWNLEKKKKYQKEAKLILEKLRQANPYLTKRLEEKIENYEQFFV